jgi:hypothetical protein
MNKKPFSISSIKSKIYNLPKPIQPPQKTIIELMNITIEKQQFQP